MLCIYSYIIDYKAPDGTDMHGGFQAVDPISAQTDLEHARECAESIINGLREKGCIPQAVFWVDGNMTLDELTDLALAPGDKHLIEYRERIHLLWASDELISAARSRKL